MTKVMQVLATPASVVTSSASASAAAARPGDQGLDQFDPAVHHRESRRHGSEGPRSTGRFPFVWIRPAIRKSGVLVNE